MGLAEAFKEHSEEIVQAASSAPFIVFLCGPNIGLQNRSARLRRRLKRDLEKDGFEVVLGEDEGLDNATLKSIGINPQDNEMEFIRSYCGAVVIVADSVGAFCELGLFSWHLVHDKGMFDGNKTYCIVLLNEKYQNDISYLNLGPVAAIDVFGRVEFINFSEYDSGNVLKRLRQRRGFSTLDSRGNVSDALSYIAQTLQQNHALRLNGEKTRIASRGGQQRVTGVVVNDQAAPPRILRRNIRSAFHEASKHPEQYSARISELGGYLGYLKMFPKFASTETIQRYEAVLRQIRGSRHVSNLGEQPGA